MIISFAYAFVSPMQQKYVTSSHFSCILRQHLMFASNPASMYSLDLIWSLSEERSSRIAWQALCWTVELTSANSPTSDWIWNQFPTECKELVCYLGKLKSWVWIGLLLEKTETTNELVCYLGKLKPRMKHSLFCPHRPKWNWTENVFFHKCYLILRIYFGRDSLLYFIFIIRKVMTFTCIFHWKVYLFVTY